MIAPRPQPSHENLPAQPVEAGGRLADGWALLHEAGAAVARLAQLGEEAWAYSPHDFALRAAAAGPARLALAEQAIDDCAAALHFGLTALIGAVEKNQDHTAAALTLWREFDRAREGLLALTAPAH